jgi:GPH family glycoside/pentoside/hexuronide:cation symporter
MGDLPADPHATPASERVPLRTKLAFGLPSIAGAAIAIPISVHMPKFYADDVLVPLGWIAVGIALARALDAITDPAMGWLSDHTRSRWGRRKPWIAVGVPLCAISLVALFTPPESLDASRAAVWFGVTFIAYFLLHTVYDIPHYGLGAELTLDYNERTSLFGVRSAFILIGVVSVYFAVLLVAFYALMLVAVHERPEFASRGSNPLVPACGARCGIARSGSCSSPT